MDWLDAMSKQYQMQAEEDEDMKDEDDFYEPRVNGTTASSTATLKDTLPGASQTGTAMVGLAGHHSQGSADFLETFRTSTVRTSVQHQHSTTRCSQPHKRQTRS